jgi:hypothetical protein
MGTNGQGTFYLVAVSIFNFRDVKGLQKCVENWAQLVEHDRSLRVA